MAWSDIGGLGNSASKTAGTSFTDTTGATLNADVGDIFLATIIVDNIAGTTGTTNIVTAFADTAGNTFTKIIEHGLTNASGGVAIATYISHLTNAIIAGTTQWTATFSGSVTAKAIGTRQLTVAAGKTYSVAGTQTGTQASSTSSASITLNIGSAPATSRLWIAPIGIEGPTADTWTRDGDFTTVINGVGTNAGAADTNVNQRTDRLISSSLTTVTHQGTISVARPSVSTLIALDEVNIGGGGGAVGFDYWGGGYYG